MRFLGFEYLTRAELQDMLDETRDAVRRLAAENFHLHRTLDQTGHLLSVAHRKNLDTEHFLAVLQGEQIAASDD